MADIETTIFKLELDGSAYIAGADKLAASTTKLSDAQTKANQKLAELQKTHNTYKKSLEEINAVLKANEKETIELSKQLNALKDSEKGASAEADRLKAALRGIATNTKEFKIEAKELSANLAATTNQLKVQTKEVQAAEKANVNFTGGLTKVYTGLSRVAALIPGLGIGSLIAIVSGPLINAFTKWYESLNKTSSALRDLRANQENLNEINAAANKDSGKQITDLKILYQAATDVNLSLKDRLAAVNELQKQFPDYFKNIADETILNGGAEKQYIALSLAIQATARAKAAKEKLDVLETQKLDLDVEKTKTLIGTANELAKARKLGATFIDVGQGVNIRVTEEENRRRTQAQIRNRRDEKLADIKEKADAIQREIDFIIDFAGLAKLAKTVEDEDKGKPKTNKAVTAIRDDFEARKAALLEAIENINVVQFETELNIRKKFEAKLKKALLDIKEDKGLKPDERIELIELTNKLIEKEQEKALKDLAKKQRDARQKLNNELRVLQDKNMQDMLNLLQDDFDKRAKLIEFNEKRELENSEENTKNRLHVLYLERLLIGEKAYQEAKAKIISEGEQNSLNIIQKFANERKDLAAAMFQELLGAYDQAISDADLIRDEDQAKALTDLKKRFLAQEITFKEFTAEIKKIKAAHDRDMREGDLIVLKDQLAELDRKIASIEDKTTKHYDKLLKKQKEFRKKIAAKESEAATDVPPPEDEPQIKKLLAYVNAISDLANSVISFWQKANDAESKALDRSIALQEKRVTAAQRIAERGNAQYLKAEEDRLKNLQVQRENAARKQLGINAALQGSEILVALISGIAQGAKTIGPLGAIIALGAVAAAIAGAFAIAESLKPPVQTFFTGTKDTGKGGAVDNKGGFTATLHPDEAVIPADRNKAYKPAIAAIYDKTIPAEHLNAFVRNYHQIKSIPLPDYGRIKESAELSIGRDGKMHIAINDQNKLIIENNDLQRATLKALKTIGVNVNMDKNGFAMSIMEVAEQIKINSKV